ncbi:hypothetical protein LTR95_011517 [Oleoguttula sp. CCFEE 5521]
MPTPRKRPLSPGLQATPTNISASDMATPAAPRDEDAAVYPSSPPTAKRKREKDGATPAPKQLRKRGRMGVKECIVCTENVVKSRFPKLLHASAEQHTSDVCFKCWEQHLKVEVVAKDREIFSCPQCSQALEADEIRKLARADTFADYLDKAASSFLASEEEFFACTSAACSFGAYIVSNDGNIFRCPGCQTRSCTVCKAPFHEGQTCAEHQQAIRMAHDHAQENEQSEALVKEISKPCPGCGINLQKNGGCDHMSCGSLLPSYSTDV